MKKFFWFLVAATTLTSITNAQLRKIPSSVTDAFSTRYPHAEKVEWSDRLTNFAATFILNGAEMKAGFSNSGEWKYSEKKIAFDELPADIRDGFSKSKYADWSRGAVSEIETNGKALEYRIVAEKSAPFQKRKLYFNPNGKLLRDNIAL